MFKPVAYFLVTCLIFDTGDSIKCYDCNSDNDANCKDPINTDAIKPVDCSASGIGGLYESFSKGLKGLGNIMGTDFKGPDISFACQKMVASEDEGRSVTVRSCTVSKSSGLDPCSTLDKLEKDLKGKVRVDFCDSCETDNCNGASKLFSGMLFLIIVSSLAVIMTTYFSA